MRDKLNIAQTLMFLSFIFLEIGFFKVLTKLSFPGKFFKNPKKLAFDRDEDVKINKLHSI